jgi:hypothetical protein
MGVVIKTILRVLEDFVVFVHRELKVVRHGGDQR